MIAPAPVFPARAKKQANMSPLLKALRARFRTPQDCLKVLGIDERVLRSPQLAFDARSTDDPDTGALRTELEKLLCESLSGDALEKARTLLSHHLGGEEYVGPAEIAAAEEAEAEAAEDHGDDDEELKPEPEPEPETKASRRAKVSSFLKEKGSSDADLAEFWRIVDAEIDQARERRNGVVGDRQARQKLAADAAADRSFLALFPEAARFTARSALESGLESAQERESRPQVAVDHVAMGATVRGGDWLDQLTRRIGIA